MNEEERPRGPMTLIEAHDLYGEFPTWKPEYRLLLSLTRALNALDEIADMSPNWMERDSVAKSELRKSEKAKEAVIELYPLCD